MVRERRKELREPPHTCGRGAPLFIWQLGRVFKTEPLPERKASADKSFFSAASWAEEFGPDRFAASLR